MKLNSQVRTIECKHKQYIDKYQKSKDQMEAMNNQVAELENKIKNINESIYSREFKLKKLHDEYTIVAKMQEQMQPIEDVDNVIKQNQLTMRDLKSNLREKATQQASLLNKKYILEKECNQLSTKLHNENKKLVKTEEKISDIKTIQTVMTRKLEREDVTAAVTCKRVKAALSMFNLSNQSKQLRKSR